VILGRTLAPARTALRLSSTFVDFRRLSSTFVDQAQPRIVLSAGVRGDPCGLRLGFPPALPLDLGRVLVNVRWCGLWAVAVRSDPCAFRLTAEVEPDDPDDPDPPPL
jgi:hypothetical protein